MSDITIKVQVGRRKPVSLHIQAGHDFSLVMQTIAALHPTAAIQMVVGRKPFGAKLTARQMASFLSKIRSAPHD